MALALHVVLALVLTGVLICQARAFAIVFRSWRMLVTRRRPRITDLIWVAIPVAVVLFLAARSWVVALDLGSPAESADKTLSVLGVADHPEVTR